MWNCPCFLIQVDLWLTVKVSVTPFPLFSGLFLLCATGPARGQEKRPLSLSQERWKGRQHPPIFREGLIPWPQKAHVQVLTHFPIKPFLALSLFI